MANRTAKVAAANAGSAVGESIPVYGIAVIAAATTYELYEACAMMKDLRELEVLVDDNAEIDSDDVCGLPLPTREELWQSVKNSPRAAWQASKDLYAGLPEWEELDVGGRVGRGWTTLTDWVWPDAWSD